MIDPDNPTSRRSPVDWNDNDRIDTDWMNGDGNGGNGAGGIPTSLPAKLTSYISEIDSNGTVKVTLI